MLTGPVTILQWSFVRDDQPRRETCQQIGLAIQDEVVDLEAAGCAVLAVPSVAGVVVEPGPRRRVVTSLVGIGVADLDRLVRVGG